jgi:hypothetical protein
MGPSGVPGVQGAGAIRFLGEWDNASDVPGAPRAAGDIYFNTRDHILYTWVGPAGTGEWLPMLRGQRALSNYGRITGGHPIFDHRVTPDYFDGVTIDVADPTLTGAALNTAMSTAGLTGDFTRTDWLLGMIHSLCFDTFGHGQYDQAMFAKRHITRRLRDFEFMQYNAGSYNLINNNASGNIGSRYIPWLTVSVGAEQDAWLRPGGAYWDSKNKSPDSRAKTG